MPRQPEAPSSSRSYTEETDQRRSAATRSRHRTNSFFFLYVFLFFYFIFKEKKKGFTCGCRVPAAVSSLLLLMSTNAPSSTISYVEKINLLLLLFLKRFSSLLLLQTFFSFFFQFGLDGRQMKNLLDSIAGCRRPAGVDKKKNNNEEAPPPAGRRRSFSSYF